MIEISDSAVSRVKEILKEENDPSLKLRFFVHGGGCSGFEYGFTLDDKKADDDFEFEKDGVSILVDALSFQYVQGAKIDFKKSLTQSQFVIENPNAKSTCGCGTSFSVEK